MVLVLIFARPSLYPAYRLYSSVTVIIMHGTIIVNPIPHPLSVFHSGKNSPAASAASLFPIHPSIRMNPITANTYIAVFILFSIYVTSQNSLTEISISLSTMLYFLDFTLFKLHNSRCLNENCSRLIHL